MGDNPEILQAQFYRTNCPEAGVYADLLSTKADLEYAKTYALQSLEPQFEPAKPALFNALHISYRRAFNRGRGGLGTSDIKALGGDAAQVHEYHLGQADKLIAHSVNGFEQYGIAAMVQDGKYCGIAHVGFRMVGLPPEDTHALIALIDRLLAEALAPRIGAGFAALNIALKAMPVSQIERAGPLNMAAPPKDKVRQSRP